MTTSDDVKYRNLFRKAIKKNDVEGAKRLLDDHPELMYVYPGQRDPLLKAAIAGHSNLIALLEPHRRTMSAHHYELCELMRCAVRDKRIESVKLLLKRGVAWEEALERWSFEEDWLLADSLVAGTAFQEQLYALGAPYDAVLSYYAQYDLERIDRAVVMRLLAMGVDGGPALLEAATHGSPEFARALLEGGTDSMMRNAAGETALHLCAVPEGAAYHGWDFYGDEIAVLLLDAGADANALDHGGMTPLSLCAWDSYCDQRGRFRRYSQEQELANLACILIDRGANVNHANPHNGYRPLHFAAERGNVAVAQVLLTAGADLGVQDKAGRSPHDVAVAAGKAEIVGLLG